MSDAMLTYEAMLDRDLNWALREGSMHFEGESAVHKTLRHIARRIDELGIDYAVVDGMAMFLHGFRRFTEDVDLLVTAEGLAAIHRELEGRGFVRPFEKSKNLRDSETRVKIDFLITGQFPGDGKPGPIAYPDPRTASEERAGLRVLKLEELIQLKLASGKEPHRGGDLADVQRLIQSLDLPEDFADRLDPSLRESYLAKWNDAQRAAKDEY